jgi:hypothetical protein
MCSRRETLQMSYLAYLWNKYYTFFKTLYHVIKVLYKAKSEVLGFSVNIITEDCMKEFDNAVEERENHLDELRAEREFEKYDQLLDKSKLN